jgi:hypothetical protein
MGVDPNTGQPVGYRAEWPGAMAMLAGIDLLAKFFSGCDTGKAGDRFLLFIDRFFVGVSSGDRKVIYQLRNSLLHSFGLYSKDRKGRVYRFLLTDHGTDALIAPTPPPPDYHVDLLVLHREFGAAVEAYSAALNSDLRLQDNFNKMFGRYGCIHIG